MQKRYDVIITGCGPAGTSAGRVLAERGLSVAILDRATFPRRKLCGGLLTWKSIQLLSTVFGLTPKRMIDEGIVNHVSDQYAIRTFDRPLAAGTLSYPFHFTDRTVFDVRLLAMAKEAGAKVFEGAAVKLCDPETGTVTLADGTVFEGEYVIGADGANSTVRRSFPHLNRERLKRYMAPALEISLPPEAFPTPVEHPELIVGFINAGYGWVFPNRDRVILGICGLRHGQKNFSELFANYLEQLGVDPAAVPQYHAHPLPYGNYLSDPCHGRVLLAGDAGGFVEPLFGEGIFYALCTGLYAAQAATEGLDKQRHPGPLYSSRLHRQIIPELRASDRLRWSLFKAMRYAGPLSLEMFVNAAITPLAEMVHGMRSYSLLRRKRWDFL